ncbi:MAG TPA: cytochrome P460 family protein [Thermodesulfovibrionales bacterium]|nr:cytochrome P460 family protein [Thermodesulfovibrionales bacterium]
MKKILSGLLALAIVSGFCLTAYAIHEIIPSETRVAEPEPDAEKLNEYIVKYNPYRAWELWPGKGRLYKGTEPHGAFLTTFVNPAAYFSVKNRSGMADGSLIVKENYGADKKFVALTVMYKVKGYNPVAGNWFWAKYAPDGKVLASGKVDACIGCHGTEMSNDYIMTGVVK